MASLEEQIEALESTLNAMDHEKEEPKDSSKVAMVRMDAEDMTDEDKKETRKAFDDDEDEKDTMGHEDDDKDKKAKDDDEDEKDTSEDEDEKDKKIASLTASLRTLTSQLTIMKTKPLVSQMLKACANACMS